MHLCLSYLIDGLCTTGASNVIVSTQRMRRRDCWFKFHAPYTTCVGEREGPWVGHTSHTESMAFRSLFVPETAVSASEITCRDCVSARLDHTPNMHRFPPGDFSGHRRRGLKRTAIHDARASSRDLVPLFFPNFGGPCDSTSSYPRALLSYTPTLKAVNNECSGASCGFTYCQCRANGVTVETQYHST